MLKTIPDLTWKSKVVEPFNFTGEGKDVEVFAGGWGDGIRENSQNISGIDSFWSS